MQLAWCPSPDLKEARNPYVEPVSAITSALDRDWSSPAWNVAGRKVARCQQMRQSLAELLDGAETQPVSKEERCREVLISSHFPASVIICSVWLIYRLRRTSWNVNKPGFSTIWSTFTRFKAEGHLPPTKNSQVHIDGYPTCITTIGTWSIKYCATKHDYSM